MKEQELFSIPVPKPTTSYAPVANENVVNEIKTQIDKLGLIITNQNYQSAQQGNIVTGIYDIQSNSSEFNYRVGFQNSYNKQRPLSFVGGTSVFICTNGMVLGDTIFMRRHTGSIVQEMRHHIKEAFHNLSKELEYSVNISRKMKSIELDPTATAELCGRLFMEQEIISSSQMNIIKSQLKNPDYAEFTDLTLWSLYNHTTHALKSTHAYEYNQKHKQLQTFVEQEFKL